MFYKVFFYFCGVGCFISVLEASGRFPEGVPEAKQKVVILEGSGRFLEAFVKPFSSDLENNRLLCAF